MFGTHRISWIKLLFALFLVAGLPIFIWAVATQRIELRKKAATSEPTEICWNRVIFFNNNYNWPNSCKGSPRTDLACSQVLVPLSANEVTGYKSWISAGKPYIPGCGGPAPSTTPAITCNSLANSQPQYFTQCLQAGFPKVCFDKFTGVYQGCNTADYDGCTLHNTNAARNLSCDSSITPPVPGECSPCGPVGPCPGGLVCKSFPVGPGGCTDDGNGHTLCNEPARQWLCVKSDGSSNCPITPTPYPSCTMPPACAYANPSCAYAVQGVTYCPIKPTTTPVSCGPNGATCTITNCPPAPTCPSGTACPRPVCTVQRGICQNNRCVSTYPTPTPSSGCYYKQVQCFQAPCPSILVCSTPTPYPSSTPTPTVIIPTKTGCIQSPAYTEDGCYGYRLISSLESSSACYSYDQCLPMVGNGMCVKSPTYVGDLCNGYRVMQGISRSCYSYEQCQAALITPTPTPSPSPTPTPTPTPMPVNLTFKVKLAGVNGPEAKGATINVKLKLQNGTVLPLDKPLVLDSVGNGVYAATATLTNPFPPGTPMRVLIKGEKHSQVVFCRTTGQTEPCNDTEYITPSSYSFDFTGRPLPPGDLNQNGKVNADDLKLITDLFKKTSTQLTAQDLKSADVDYSGTIDAYDLNLVLQTLETRYDEQ